MSPTTLDRFRRKLESLRRRIRADAASVVEQTLAPSGGQGDGALSNAPFHLGDNGAEEFLHDMSAALAENEQYLIREATAALARIADGSFGRCEHCGGPIAAERLDAMPYVRFCITCAATTSPGLDVNLNDGRPRTPADTLAPEGSMQEDWRPGGDALTGSRKHNVAANDEHAAGEPGGGAAIGGLAGTNVGSGEPTVSDLQDAAGSGAFDRDDARDDRGEAPRSGPSGGAVGGAPARKRAK